MSQTASFLMHYRYVAGRQSRYTIYHTTVVRWTSFILAIAIRLFLSEFVYRAFDRLASILRSKPGHRDKRGFRNAVLYQVLTWSDNQCCTSYFEDRTAYLL